MLIFIIFTKNTLSLHFEVRTKPSIKRITMKLLPPFLLLCPCLAMAQSYGTKTEYTDFENDTLQLDQVEVNMSRGNRLKLQHVTSNTEIIGQQQLVMAACCNLGESFVTNPSVDVNYSDAATGARQIKLLGLSGTYVQMMTENVPNLRGAAIPFALSFVPGPWMQSIQVSKGASSVRNGYESTTGQINIEYLKPQAIDGVRANAYLDNKLKYELNLDASHHFTDKFSASILTHFEDRQEAHDGNNDGFVDMPKQRQWNVMPRLAYVAPNWISQLYVRALHDERESGQIGHHAQHLDYTPYTIGINTERYEAQWKNGFPFNDGHNTSIALMLHGSWHDAENKFGLHEYNVLQKNGYAQLMFETDLTERHNLSVGASVNHDYYKERLQKHQMIYADNLWHTYNPNDEYDRHSNCAETTSGLYAQYTYKIDEMLSVMAGIRGDYSDFYRYWFFTPRFHLKYSPNELFTLRASAGKGYRTPHDLAENTSLLITGREPLLLNGYSQEQEEAWNYGLSASLSIPIGGKDLELNAEYYYTNFLHQMVIDHEEQQEVIDGNHLFIQYLTFSKLHGQSYSHTLQVDASYPLIDGLSALAAFRYNDARTTYLDGKLHQRPLTSRYKGLLTLSYKTPLEFWQFDVTGQLNGPGELYDHLTKYPSYFQLQAQVTREFQHFSLYIGGENLTNYKINDPILHANAPWSALFDATQVWGPVEGAMFYAGIRFKLEKE